MEIIPLNKLLFTTAFCCMASDGQIDDKEIKLIESFCEKSSQFINFDFKKEINELLLRIKSEGKEFIKYFFNLLEKTTLTEDEELLLIDFAIKTIKADEKIEYSEIKFFKNIRYRLKVSDEKILDKHPDIEYWLEADITKESSIEKITNQYLDAIDQQQFELMSIDFSIINKPI